MMLTRALVLAALSAIQVEAQTVTRPVEGSWLVTLTPPNRGEVTVRMQFARDGATRWRATSRTGAARQMVSWWKYHFGRLAGKVPGRGALAYIERGDIVAETADSVVLRGDFRSPMLGNFVVHAVESARGMVGELRRDSTGPAVGTIRGVRDTSSAPIRNYPALSRSIQAALREGVFDPRLVVSPKWRAFFDGLDHDMSRAGDDLDVLAAFYARAQRLGTSHVYLSRDPVLAKLPLDSLLTRVAGPPETLVHVRFPATGVGYLGVTKWDQVARVVDRAFARFDSAHIHTLILDIRGNPGGDSSPGAVLSHVFSDTAYVGAAVTNKWFTTHQSPPTSAQQAAFTASTRDEGMDVINILRAEGAVRFAAAPRQPYFAGKMYVLTDGRTGSASEPVAHFLKSSGRATLIGARTAGAVLTALPHDVGDGWVLALPEADYYSGDGTRLEGNGVRPHIDAPSNDALLVAAADIAKTNRRAGLVVRTSALIAMRRWGDAIAAYRDVVAVSGAEVPSLRTTLERSIQQQLSRVPDDAEARAALRTLTESRSK